MDFPDTLNVAIGVVVLYFLLSTIGSALIELISRTLRYREELLISTTNSLITGLEVKPWSKTKLFFDRIKGETIREIQQLLSGDTPAEIIRNDSGDVISQAYPEYSTRDVVGATPRQLHDNVSVVRSCFWEHSKIRALRVNNEDAPSAIEPETFADVVIEIAVPRDSGGALPQSKVALEQRLQGSKEAVPQALSEALRNLSLSSSIPDNASGESFWKAYRGVVADWYFGAMANASDRYKRTTQRWLLCVGFFMVLVLNADTIRVIHLLSTSGEQRDAAVELAQRIHNMEAQGEAATGEKQENTDELKKGLGDLQSLVRVGYPIGWGSGTASNLYPYRTKTLAHDNADADKKASAECIRRRILLAPFVFVIDNFGGVSYKILGLLLTTFAINLGAPFWHNLLGKLISVRSRISPKVEEPGEQSERKEVRADDASTFIEEPVPLEINRDLSASVGRFDARKAYWLAEASLLAYEHEAQIKRKVTKDWFLPKPEYWNIKKKHVDTQVFAVATEKIAIISFRGTEAKVYNDLLTDISLKLVPAGGSGSELLHAGFYEALDSVYAQLLEWIEMNKVKSKMLYITGHSLGGALSLILAYRMAKDAAVPFESLSVYNFGCPRVGDDTFAARYDRSLGANTYRVIHGNDAVSKVPPRTMHFRHVGTSVYFRKPEGVAYDVVSLDRFLDMAIEATDDLSQATSSALGDHSMEIYVERCLGLTGAKVG